MSDVIQELSPYIGSQTIQNISSYLGESEAAVQTGMELSLRSFMGALLKQTHSDIETKKIINVLEDGGHTGDILNNIEAFSGNFEKAKLLVNVGNNIVNHFFVNRSQAVINKIAEASGLSNSSASSTFSIAAPVILGILGKNLKERQLDTQGFKNYMLSYTESIITHLPESIVSLLNIRRSKKTASEKKDSENQKLTNQSLGWKFIIPWLLLGLFGLGAWYYLKHIKLKSPKETETITVQKEDSVKTSNETSDYLPEDPIEEDLANQTEDRETIKAEDNIKTVETPPSAPPTIEIKKKKEIVEAPQVNVYSFKTKATRHHKGISKRKAESIIQTKIAITMTHLEVHGALLMH